MYCIFEIYKLIKMNLIIDVGNTRVKVAVFEKDTVVNVVFFE